MKTRIFVMLIVLSCSLYPQAEKTEAILMSATRGPEMLEVQAGTGKIVGTVIDLVSRKPIAKATVELLGTDRTVTTGNDGQYVLDKVGNGFYQIKAGAAGYIPEIQNNIPVKANDEQRIFFTLQTDPMNPPDFLEVDIHPKPVENPAPKYPASAKKEGVEATVWVKMIISEKGYPERVQVIKTTLEQNNTETVIRDESDERGLTPLLKGILNDLRGSARDAAQAWKFTPAVLKGEPVRIWVSVPFRYKLAEAPVPTKKK
jgi:hypothetical protein